MRIINDLVAGSIGRLNFDPVKRNRAVTQETRSKWVTAESRERRRQALTEAIEDPARAALVLERVIGGNDLVGIVYLERGMRAARAVCRIQLRSAPDRLSGYGTGFLVAPGVLMTNHHVLASLEDARFSLAEFDYEVDVQGRNKTSTRFALDPQRLFYANKDLDFAVTAVAPVSSEENISLDRYGLLPLSGEPGKGIVGEYLTIIQHPGGERKQICVRENKLLKYADDTLWYQTDTVAG